MHTDERRAAFGDLHRDGTFLMPNPFDAGSARLLEALGFKALATTSSGFAASKGQRDMTVSRDEVVEHARTICAATDLPVNIDAEQCFPTLPGGVARTVSLLAEAGASGCSIEDWSPARNAIDELSAAVDRVGEAAAAASEQAMVLTARAENHLRGVQDLDDTIRRLCAYRDAGAHAVYAPGLTDLTAIARVVEETASPVNVLLLPGGPTVQELSAVGVRRLSVGGALARIAYGAAMAAATTLLDEGSLDEDAPFLSRDLADRAFQ
jgi:2-methylisocitrate lyase-like PEP mutase family enzyme